MPLLQNENKYTYADYCTWDDDQRWELIDGEVYSMSPAPGRRHQELLGEFFSQVYNYLKGKSCKAFISPFDVRLDPDGADDTVVQPDLLVVCDKSKLDGKGCNGAPDFIVEILSPSTARRDRIDKLEKYRQSGVREYWIVDPETRSVQVCTLKDSLYFVSGYTDEDKAPVGVIDGLVIDLAEAFGPREEESEPIQLGPNIGK